MLKKIAIALMLILPMGVFAQTAKFGHFVSQEVLVLMPEYTKASTDLEAFQKTFADEMETIVKEFNTKYQKFQQDVQEGTLPQNILERRSKDLEELAMNRDRFEQDAMQQIRAKSDELLAPIWQKLEGAVKEIGAAEGYVYIFDLSRTYIPYIDEKQSTDITPKLKTKLGI